MWENIIFISNSVPLFFYICSENGDNSSNNATISFTGVFFSYGFLYLILSLELFLLSKPSLVKYLPFMLLLLLEFFVKFM